MTTVQSQVAQILRTNEENVKARILGLKLGDCCSRCGGCGEYSFNMMYGTVCFKCDGKGNVLPGSDAAWKRVLKRAQELPAAELDAYINRLKLQKLAAKAEKVFFAKWQEADKVFEYDWRAAAVAEPGTDVYNRAESNKACYEAHKVLEKSIRTKDVEQIVKTLEAGLEIIKTEMQKWS